MNERAVKRIDLLRHELKALRFMLDKVDEGQLAAEMPVREDFQSEQGRAIYDAIAGASSRASAAAALAGLELDEVDIASFLRLSGEHYYSYPGLVRERAAAIRRGALKVEAA
jgi:hypothetical protein